jgi:hypothetical protein
VQEFVIYGQAFKKIIFVIMLFICKYLDNYCILFNNVLNLSNSHLVNINIFIINYPKVIDFLAFSHLWLLDLQNKYVTVYCILIRNKWVLLYNNHFYFDWIFFVWYKNSLLVNLSSVRLRLSSLLWYSTNSLIQFFIGVTCNFFFYMKNSHQSFQFYPLCIALFSR